MEFLFDHIGIAVFDIEKAAFDYRALGYEVGEAKNVDVFQAKAAYASKVNSPTIELLEPADEKSPVASGPYHTCYAVCDIQEAMLEMRRNSFLPLGKPVPGPGLDNALTVFMYKKSIGLIQLVERK